MTADFYARKASELSAQCTEEERRRRRENGRRPNVAHVFTEEETDAFFLGTPAAGVEGKSQSSAFGTSIFANA